MEAFPVCYGSGSEEAATMATMATSDDARRLEHLHLFNPAPEDMDCPVVENPRGVPGCAARELVKRQLEEEDDESPVTKLRAPRVRG